MIDGITESRLVVVKGDRLVLPDELAERGAPLFLTPPGDSVDHTLQDLDESDLYRLG